MQNMQLLFGFDCHTSICFVEIIVIRVGEVEESAIYYALVSRRHILPLRKDLDCGGVQRPPQTVLNQTLTLSEFLGKWVPKYWRKSEAGSVLMPCQQSTAPRELSLKIIPGCSNTLRVSDINRPLRLQ